MSRSSRRSSRRAPSGSWPCAGDFSEDEKGRLHRTPLEDFEQAQDIRLNTARQSPEIAHTRTFTRSTDVVVLLDIDREKVVQRRRPFIEPRHGGHGSKVQLAIRFPEIGPVSGPGTGTLRPKNKCALHHGPASTGSFGSAPHSEPPRVPAAPLAGRV